MHGLTIGEVAKQAHVRLETLRYYERQGLIARPPRSSSNYRVYPTETVRRVRFIKRAQQLGFSLQEITELLALWAEPTVACGDVRERAITKLNDIEDKIRALQTMQAALVRLIAMCGGNGPLTDCPILEALNMEEGT
jgi:MerR family transcriptional regulator, copper efflux regulator